MRAWQTTLVSLVVGWAGTAAAQHGHSQVELNLFGSRSVLSFGVGVHTHAHRRVVVAPPPVVVTPPAPVVVAPPVVMAPPPMVAAPVYVAPVVVQAPPPQVVHAPAPQVVSRPAPREVERPALIGLKYTPGLSGAFAASGDAASVSGVRFVHSAGLEARLSRWVALRSDVEFRNDSRSYDVLGAKLWLAGADWQVKPYLSASLSGTTTAARPNALVIGAMGAAGLDVFIGKHFFLEAELRYRALPGGCCAEVPQVTGVVGAGVAFF